MNGGRGGGGGRSGGGGGRGGRGGRPGGGGKPRSGPPRSGPPRSGPPRSGPPRSGAPRSGAPRSGAPRSGPPRGDRPSARFRRDEGFPGGDRGPRREDRTGGGGFKGPRPAGGGFKGPRPAGGGFKGPRPAGGSFKGPRRDDRAGGFDRGPRREGERGPGFKGDRGGFKGGRDFGGSDRGPRREGDRGPGGFKSDRGGFKGDRGGFKGGRDFGGSDRGPRREGDRGGFKSDRGGFKGDRGGFKGGRDFGGSDRGPRREGDRGPGGFKSDRGGFKGGRDFGRGAPAARGGRDFARGAAAGGAFKRPKPERKPREGANEGIRLQALMARAGVASRREAEQMILEGRVTKNGEVVSELGTRAIPEVDHIKVDGKLISAEERKVYILFNKPREVITAVSDPKGRPVVTDYVKVRERVFPVGRLDWDTEGLLLLTNDGDLAYRLTHPKYEMPRTYHAKVKGIPDEKTVIRLRRGLRLEDGKASVQKAQILEVTEQNAWLEIVVSEGRNRLVRRLLEAVGHPVTKLKRVAYAGLGLGDLRPGASRLLSQEEVAKLKKKVADATPQAPPRGRFAPPPPSFRPGPDVEAGAQQEEEAEAE